jgi:hypothetical protein
MTTIYLQSGGNELACVCRQQHTHARTGLHPAHSDDDELIHVMIISTSQVVVHHIKTTT